MIQTVTIRLKNKTNEIILPTNPEHLPIRRESKATKVEIASLGEIAVPTTPTLASIVLESFFWFDELQTGKYTYSTPKQYADWFDAWQLSKKPMRFVVDEMHYDMWVLCELFECDRKAGEDDDIYYKLELVEFRPYGARIIQTPASPIATTTQSGKQQALPEVPKRIDDKPPVGVTYTVKSGDSLWAISRKLSGNGGTDWRELYNANIDIVGANPNLIQPGMVLKIPEKWVTK